MVTFDPFLGRADVTAWAKYEVKGNLLNARPRYVREKWGDRTAAEVAAKLAPEARAIFENPVLPFAWHPFPLLTAIDRALVEGPMSSQVSQMKAFGSIIARYDLTTLYKVLFKIGSPAFVLKRIATVYQTYVRGGAVTPVEVTSRHALLALSEGALPLYFCGQGIPGWIHAAVELSGGKGVTVEEVECLHRGAVRCAWRAEWA